MIKITIEIEESDLKKVDSLMKKNMNRNDVIAKMIRNYEEKSIDLFLESELSKSAEDSIFAYSKEEKKLYSKCNTNELTSMYIEFCTKTLKRATPRKTSFINDLNSLGFKCYEHQTCKYTNENPFEVQKLVLP